MMVMAMIETTELQPEQRDTSKDNCRDGSANASIFNLSEDLLRQLGYHGDIHHLDPLSNIGEVVRIIDRGMDRWGVTRTLNFVRGGRKAFDDGVSYKAAEYRTAVATAITLVDNDPDFMVDNRRIEMNVSHQ